MYCEVDFKEEEDGVNSEEEKEGCFGSTGSFQKEGGGPKKDPG